MAKRKSASEKHVITKDDIHLDLAEHPNYEAFDLDAFLRDEEIEVPLLKSHDQGTPNSNIQDYKEALTQLKEWASAKKNEKDAHHLAYQLCQDYIRTNAELRESQDRIESLSGDIEAMQEQLGKVVQLIAFNPIVDDR
ncbi:uncharacterized protein VTP21DRAFT_3382 [Calcarisporiella thermophila]|uniref:uncharacterized protein n=1 Tax=Calcarisporiella thermophila TaxID=911321 RepID=UPI003742DC0D